MKKIIFFLIILIFVSTIAYTGEKPYHTGKNTMGYSVLVHVEGQGGYNECSAVFAESMGVIGGAGEECSFHLAINNNKIIARCICPYDIQQAAWEQRSAEVGYIPDCIIQVQGMDPGSANGTGFIITAANDANEELGGQVTMICMADVADLVD